VMLDLAGVTRPLVGGPACLPLYSYLERVSCHLGSLAGFISRDPLETGYHANRAVTFETRQQTGTETGLASFPAEMKSDGALSRGSSISADDSHHRRVWM